MDCTAEGTLVTALLVSDAEIGIAQASLIVQPEDFQDSDKATLYRAMLTLAGLGRPIDCANCFWALEEMKVKPEDANRIVAEAFDGAPIRGKIPRYAQMVKEKSRSKRVSKTIELAGVRLAEGENVRWVKNELLADIQQSESDEKSDEDCRLADSIGPVLQAISDRMAGDTSRLGLQMGIHALDNLTTGINREEFWVVGGLPGRGKTAIALQTAVEIAGNGFPVYYISLEMSRFAVMRRLLKMKFGSAAIENPGKQFDQLRAYEQDIRSIPLYVNDASSMEIDDLCTRARMRIARSGIRLVIVDYLQLIRCEGRDRRERVGEAADRLRRLAKDTGVPVMALSQLRRPANLNDRPTMVDLKESGDIEAHAHVVLLLYMPDRDEHRGEDEIIIGKQREGPTGKVDVRFIGSKGQFYERETCR